MGCPSGALPYSWNLEGSSHVQGCVDGQGRAEKANLTRGWPWVYANRKWRPRVINCLPECWHHPSTGTHTAPHKGWEAVSRHLRNLFPNIRWPIKLAKQGHYWPHNKDTEFGDRAKKVTKETNSSNKHCGGETDFQNLHITFF